MSDAKFASRRSGIMLLTSPSPIGDPGSAARQRPLTREPLFWAAAVSAGFLMAACFGRRTFATARRFWHRSGENR